MLAKRVSVDELTLRDTQLVVLKYNKVLNVNLMISFRTRIDIVERPEMFHSAEIAFGSPTHCNSLLAGT